MRRRLTSERGVAFVIPVIIGGALVVVALTLSNYVIHGDISVACMQMGLPLGTC